jgi:hypothetical protein
MIDRLNNALRQEGIDGRHNFFESSIPFDPTNSYFPSVSPRATTTISIETIRELGADRFFAALNNRRDEILAPVPSNSPTPQQMAGRLFTTLGGGRNSSAPTAHHVDGNTIRLDFATPQAAQAMGEYITNSAGIATTPQGKVG